MNQKQAKEKMKKFMGNSVFTFTMTSYPGDKWVAQCNEVDGIITCGTGSDAAVMENAMQDAICSAAGISAEFSDKILKRVWSDNQIIVSINSEIKSNTKMTLFPLTYMMNQHAGMGQI